MLDSALEGIVGAAGAAGGATYVEDVFSTYLYTGNNSTITVTNNVNLADEGGLVWIKNRATTGYGNFLFDTERGGDVALLTNGTNASFSEPNGVGVFNTNGFIVGGSSGDYAFNYSNQPYVSWTFRKAPKFFDVVTYTGNNENPQYVNHNLGVTPGCIIIKSVTDTGSWFVWHRGLSSTSHALRLNTTAAESVDTNYEIGKNASDTQIYIDSGSDINYSSSTYVAYLFAHNDGDGEFGVSGDQDIIKCGSYTGSGNNSTAPFVDLGWEPQFVITKRTDNTGNWIMHDNMRAFDAVNSATNVINANTNAAETSDYAAYVRPTGFVPQNQSNSSGTFIYIAIRRGPMKTPTTGASVFSADLASGYPRYPSNFVTDWVIQAARDSGSTAEYSRLTGENAMRPYSTDAEFSSTWDWAQMDGSGPDFTSTNYIGWSFARAPGFFDAVTYAGTGSALTVAHNLTVAPELVIFKNRTTAGKDWLVYWSGDVTKALKLNSSAALASEGAFNSTPFTSTQLAFLSDGNINQAGSNYIAWMFASCPGVSKIGTYTGNGTSQTINCGFSNGARFVIIKSTTAATEWFVFDTERGIVSGSDPILLLTSTANAEISAYDLIDPDSSGFTINYNGGFNGTNTDGETYLYLAIA